MSFILFSMFYYFPLPLPQCFLIKSTMTRASDPFSPGALMRRHALCEVEGEGERGCWRAINYQVLNLNLAPRARRAASCALGLIDFCFAKSRKRDNEIESGGERERGRGAEEGVADSLVATCQGQKI